jgi:FAD/FMN-containing dehydrogenase
MTHHVEMLQSFLKSRSTIRSRKPDEPVFNSAEAVPVVLTQKPSIIVRPSSIGDVAALVGFLALHKIDFVIRAGGHDCNARSTIEGVVQIDLRSLDWVQVQPTPTQNGNAPHGDTSQRTAKVGGGVLMGKVLEMLDEEGLLTPTGAVASVGYCGWATYGGYSPLNHLYGMGVDQIVGATIVTAKGEVAKADERILEGIRGGGGCFCVVVELEIKVYPGTEVSIPIKPTSATSLTFVS